MAVHSIDAEDDQFAYRYDTQLLIDRRDEDLDEDEIAEYITEHFEGNSLIAAGDEDLIKIHFHTTTLEDSGILQYYRRNLRYRCGGYDSAGKRPAGLRKKRKGLHETAAPFLAQEEKR